MEENKRQQFRQAVDGEKLNVSLGLFEREPFWRVRLHLVECLWAGKQTLECAQ
jgi:hypothetical protein